MPAIWGDGGVNIPQKPPPKILLRHESFWRETGKWSQLIIEIGGQSHRHPPTVCRLVDSSWSSSRWYLVHSLVTQFVHQITEGEAREEIWLSVDYLFFISTSLIYRKNRQVRQGIVWLKDLKGVLGLEMSRAWGWKELLTCTQRGKTMWTHRRGQQSTSQGNIPQRKPILPTPWFQTSRVQTVRK